MIEDADVVDHADHQKLEFKELAFKELAFSSVPSLLSDKILGS